MRDCFLDVRLELDTQALSEMDEQTRSQFVLETSRGEADRLCERRGARLRTDRAPEVLVQQGEHRLTGQRCVLVASRWAVVAPDDVQMGAPQ